MTVNAMDDLIDTIIQKLQPAMEEYADNSQFFHWMDYACELDVIALENFKSDNTLETLPVYLNKRMKDYPSGHAINHACTDVASTVESLIPEYRGKFKYE